MHYVEHHVAHLASTFFVSPYHDAAVVSVDGFGDFLGAMTGVGSGNQLAINKRVMFPHSLGLFYLALTQFLGFPHYGDEFKVMGLAAFGEPVFMDEMAQLVRLQPSGGFELGLDYFVHHTEGVHMTWDGGAPHLGSVYSPRMAELLGPPRASDEPLADRHRQIAASMQQRYEQAFFNLLEHVHAATGKKRLCLAGGCAMNSVANGKVFDATPFTDVYIPPSPGDAGGAVGAVSYVWHQKLGRPRQFVMTSPYWGPEFSADKLAKAVDQTADLRQQAICQRFDDNDALCQATAQAIADGCVVGWYQGKMEWGPRALGSRSILVDPRRAEMKDVLNSRIKRRESFRPFAPAILEEYVGEFFEHDQPDPFMSKVYKIRPEKRAADSRRRARGWHRPAANRTARGQSAVLEGDRHLPQTHWRASRDQHLVQRERADCPPARARRSTASCARAWTCWCSAPSSAASTTRRHSLSHCAMDPIAFINNIRRSLTICQAGLIG